MRELLGASKFSESSRHMPSESIFTEQITKRYFSEHFRVSQRTGGYQDYY